MEKALAVDELMEIMIILMMIMINVPCIITTRILYSTVYLVFTTIANNRSRILFLFTHIISLMFLEDKRITKTLYKADDISELIHVENEREY